jgi:hypothetical protein
MKDGLNDIIEEKNEKIQKIINEKREYRPFDGMATNRKKIKIIDFFPSNDKQIIRDKNLILEEHYPLINIISNRNSLNHSKYLMRDMLSNKNLSQTEINIISKRSYRKPIKISLHRKLPSITKFNTNEDKERKRLYINNRMSKILSIQSGKRRMNYSTKEIPLSTQFTLLYKKSKDEYKTKNLETHYINSENQENLKSQNFDINYILNGYKYRNPDFFLEKIRSDALKLRYNNHLRLHSTFK